MHNRFRPLAGLLVLLFTTSLLLAACSLPGLAPAEQADPPPHAQTPAPQPGPEPDAETGSDPAPKSEANPPTDDALDYFFADTTMYEMLSKFDAVTYSIHDSGDSLEPTRITVYWGEPDELDGTPVTVAHFLHFELDVAGDSTDPADAATDMQLWFDANGNFVAVHNEHEIYTDAASLGLSELIVAFSLFPFNLLNFVVGEDMDTYDGVEFAVTNRQRGDVLGNKAEIVTIEGSGMLDGKLTEFSMQLADLGAVTLGLEVSLTSPSESFVWTVTPEELKLR